MAGGWRPGRLEKALTTTKARRCFAEFGIHAGEYFDSAQYDTGWCRSKTSYSTSEIYIRYADILNLLIFMVADDYHFINGFFAINHTGKQVGSGLQIIRIHGNFVAAHLRN